MKIKWKRWMPALAAVLCLGLLAGCGELASSGETLEVRAGVSVLPASGDPTMETQSDGQTVLLHLYEGLMKKSADVTGKISVVPGMAKSYTEEEHFDGTVTYTFKLRDNAKWSDGRSVTAEEFVYAWQRLADPATGSPYHELLRMVKGYDAVRAGGDVTGLGVRAKNDSTLIVDLSYRCPYFLSDICTAAAAAPLRQEVVSQEGWSEWGGLLSNGPYQVIQANETALTLERSSYYYESKMPGPTDLSFQVMDSETAWQAYQEGNLDLVSSLPQQQLAERAKNPAWTVIPAASTYTIVFNNAVAPFGDTLVRQALSLAIDRSALPELVGLGTTAATGLVPPSIAGTQDETFRAAGGTLLKAATEDYAENCRQAEELLTQSGYSGGAAFPVVEYLYVATPETTAVAQAVQAMWRSTLRVSMILKPVTAEELDEALRSGSFAMAAVEIVSPVNDAMGFLEDFKSGGKDNLADYSNSAFNTLVEVIRSASDETGRLGLLHDAEQLLLDDAGVAPLYVSGGGWELRSGLTGAFQDTLGRLYLSTTTVDVNA